ncbi:MAG: S41 family peptidase [Akkermansiaceae bacterium]
MRSFRAHALALVLIPTLLPAQEEAPPPTAILPDDGMGYQHIERFIKVLETVRQNHPDGDKLDYERLINHALEGMLDSLDKFSGFYHPETYAYIRDEDRQPEVPGLGITLAKSQDFLTVTAVRLDSPAFKAGIVAGDRIHKIGARDAGKLSLALALTTLAGRPGETVKLSMWRRTDHEHYEASLLRTVIKKVAVADAMLLQQGRSKNVGYLRLTEFTAPSHRELEAALDELEDKGMRSLILDLRGNPGGLLHVSVAILGEFVPPSTEVVFTKGRNPAHNSPPMKTLDRKRKKREYPLAILIDRGSASASELVSGALQDLKRATIVGETSYGKGSVQHIMAQPGGTALRLTIAKYHTPSGRTPHEIGITPDLVVKISDSDRENLALFRRRTNLTPTESKTLQAWNDPVVEAAIKALGNIGK